MLYAYMKCSNKKKNECINFKYAICRKVKQEMNYRIRNKLKPILDILHDENRISWKSPM